MIRDYMLVSPSLEGVLNHATINYEGLKRPIEVMKILDGPAARGQNADSKKEKAVLDECEYKVLDRYFHDLYSLLMKKISHFAIAPEDKPDDIIQLQALLLELIKIKGLLKNAQK